MRITTNQVLSNYQTNLSKTTAELDTARNRVLTKRNFMKASEDPASAAVAYKLRKEYIETGDHIENVKDASSQFDAVESSAIEMSTIAKKANALILEGITGTTSLESRKTIATSLRQMQESIVMSANSKLGESFLFGGQTTDSTPFEMVDGKLQYFGLDVSSTDPAVQTKLKEMTNATVYVDLGFGLSFTSGKIDTNSAFNVAVSGLNALGFGQSDGKEQNLVNILGSIADELEKDPADSQKLDGLSKQFTESSSKLADFITSIGTKSNFLELTQTRLEDNQFTLNEKIVSVENVDLAAAITDYSWAQYAYNSALKVGNSILSQSFIDFMR
ncbi:hypothetical protein [Anaerotignum propionicum]|uniref:Flagellar hook-associated protein 3 FlgL n=1 Tax=Anaerotignum propionicum DSM 1682 TaxID=991789 RepID=A0A0X8VB80_ANAPI|nr:hypothetical protein [Anaerotignum propionicum]AMJ42407.1 flagellar hook-associated protein FlgL [Anaerotignum propionicum DSM 1682]SHF01379.1 flagellar hook-associated protein 3 FlgL [[Clostridium] propionicum DSM 1682] [Anaerotignum propionicum DSM 1682]